MIVRQFNPDSDLLMVAEWFALTAWPLPPVKNLLKADHGFVAEIDGRPAACGFLHLTGTSWAVLSWLNSNPSMSREAQDKGIQLVIKASQDMAEVVNPPVEMLTVITRTGVEQKSLEEMGFRNQSGTKVLNWIKKAGE